MCILVNRTIDITNLGFAAGKVTINNYSRKYYDTMNSMFIRLNTHGSTQIKHREVMICMVEIFIEIGLSTLNKKIHKLIVVFV